MNLQLAEIEDDFDSSEYEPEYGADLKCSMCGELFDEVDETTFACRECFSNL